MKKGFEGILFSVLEDYFETFRCHHLPESFLKRRI
jgi:hypothetical protein